jgi:hypothetical protein
VERCVVALFLLATCPNKSGPLNNDHGDISNLTDRTIHEQFFSRHIPDSPLFFIVNAQASV